MGETVRNQDKTLKNTVWLDENISIHTNKSTASSTILLRCGILFLCVLSVILTLKVTIDMPINPTIVFFAVSFPIIFTLINGMKKFKLYAIVSLIFLLLISIYLFRFELLYAVKIIRSNFMIAFNRYYLTNYYTYDVYIVFMRDYEKTKTIFTIVLSYILSGYFAFTMNRGKSIFPLLILFIPLFWGAINFGVKPHVAIILLLFFSFMSVYSLESKPRNRQNHKSNTKFGVKICNKHKLHFYQGGKLSYAIANRNWTSTIALTMSLIILILIIFPQGSYKPNKRLEISYDNLSNYFMRIKDEISIDEIANGLSQSGVGGGNLASIDRKGFANVTHLKVTLEKEVPMLLKGYVGSVYEGNRWSDLDNSLYIANEDIFLGLSNYDIAPHTIMTPSLEGLLKYADQLKGILGINQDIAIENSISIENVRANRKFAYVPYGLKSVASDENEFVRDTIVSGEAFARGEYTSTSRLLLKQDGEYSMNDMEVYQNYASREIYIDSVEEDLRKAILQYEEFVHDNYLAMPNDKLNKLKQDFKPVDSIDEAIAKVHEYLLNHAVYDLAPGKKPQGKDYIEYFLYENHKGYCSHFATAATMMFRAMGIPARYVEGYTITQYDIDFNRSGLGEVLIKDSNAHAWTEIYLSMYGWVPVDVTPGSSDRSIANPEHDVPVPDYMQTSSDVSSNVSSETPSELNSSSSNTSSDVTGNTSSNPSTKEDIQIGKVGLVFLAFLGVISAFLLVLGLKRAIIVLKRKSSFHQRDENKAAISIYSYFTDVLSFLGYRKILGETELEFAKRVTKECKFLEEESFIDITKLTLKAKFSNHSINQADVLSAENYSRKFSSDVFASLKYTDRFKYWLIDNLK